MVKPVNIKNQRLLYMTDEELNTLLTDIIRSELKRSRQIMADAFDAYERDNSQFSLKGRIKRLLFNKTPFNQTD